MISICNSHSSHSSKLFWIVLKIYSITSLSPLPESRLMVDIDIFITISNDSGNEPLLDDPDDPDDGGGGSCSRTVILEQQIIPCGKQVILHK